MEAAPSSSKTTPQKGHAFDPFPAKEPHSGHRYREGSSRYQAASLVEAVRMSSRTRAATSAPIPGIAARSSADAPFRSSGSGYRSASARARFADTPGTKRSQET